KTLTFAKKEQQFIQQLHLHFVSQALIKELKLPLDLHECCYLTIIFMTISQYHFTDEQLFFLHQASFRIVYEMERLCALHFSNKQTLEWDIFEHLVPMYFRVKYTIPLQNEL